VLLGAATAIVHALGLNMPRATGLLAAAHLQARMHEGPVAAPVGLSTQEGERSRDLCSLVCGERARVCMRQRACDCVCSQLALAQVPTLIVGRQRVPGG
jgi:hypothetical protein